MGTHMKDQTGLKQGQLYPLDTIRVGQNEFQMLQNFLWSCLNHDTRQQIDVVTVGAE